MARCPGQDQRYWTPDDIFDVRCPFCGEEIEFWKDEPGRICPGCAVEVRNPRIDLGCAKWCKAARECLGSFAEGYAVAAPVVEEIRARIARQCPDDALRQRVADEAARLADILLGAEGGDPCVIKASATLAAAGLGADLAQDAVHDASQLTAIRLTVQALAADTPLDTLEFRVAHDAATLARALSGKATLVADELELDALYTSGARALAQRRSGRPNS